MMASQKNKKRKITCEDLKLFTGVGDAQISPDGAQISFCRSLIGDGNRVKRSLWLADCKSAEIRQFTAGEADGQARWSTDGSKIVFIRNCKNKPSQFYTIKVNGGEAVCLSHLPEGAIGEYVISPDGTQIAFSFRETEAQLTSDAQKKREENELSTPPMVIEQIWYRGDGDGYFNRQRFHLYVLDLATGKHRLVYNKAPDGVGSLSWSPDGKEILLVGSKEKESMLKPWKSRLLMVNASTGKERILEGQTDCIISNALMSPDGKQIAIAARMGKVSEWASKNSLLYVYDVKKATFKCLSDKEDYCLAATVIGDMAEASFGAALVWSPDSKHIYTNLGWHGDRHIARIPVKGGKFEFLTDKPGTWSLNNISANGSAFAIVHGNLLSPGELMLGTLKNKGIATRQLTDFNGELLAGLELSVPESCYIKSPDGNDIHLWTMKPAGFKPSKKYPAVLQIHGGPHGLYGNAFFHEFQVLCAAGYVVFFSNPRGSKGYGDAHCDAIAGNWGNHDWTDIQAVTAHMKKQKFVDIRRMGIMGGSYGGYMTNWAIGHTNEFAGAITDRCVANMLSMMGTSDFTTLPDSYWPGNVWDKIDDFWKQSPVRYFGNVTTPTLIIHSEGDLRCNIEQAEQVFTILKVRNIPTRFVRYPRNTSHGMSRCGPPDLRIHRLNQILDWWKTYLKPR